MKEFELFLQFVIKINIFHIQPKTRRLFLKIAKKKKRFSRNLFSFVVVMLYTGV